MKTYKFISGGLVVHTHDKIFADFMNKNLSWFEKFLLIFK